MYSSTPASVWVFTCPTMAEKISFCGVSLTSELRGLANRKGVWTYLCHRQKPLHCPLRETTESMISAFGFLSWHAAKSFIKNLTLESFIPTSMLSINKKTMRLGVTSIASKVPDILGDTGSWRHIPRHLVRFSHAFPLDSFSRAAWTRSHVRCWQLSSLGKNLEFRYLQVMLIDIIRFTIPTP